jgi:hypothetical protein
MGIITIMFTLRLAAASEPMNCDSPESMASIIIIISQKFPQNMGSIIPETGKVKQDPWLYGYIRYL